MSTSLVDEIMGFDPTNLEVFKPAQTENGGDVNIYKPNPKFSTSEDGIYRSRIKILVNPFSPKDSIVPQAQYWVKGADGQMPVRSSLSIGDKNCPIFKAWKRLWFSGDEDKKALAKKIFEKSESIWVLVQILEDENRPELVGKFKVMKLAKDIYEKLSAKMNPSQASKDKPYPVTDYVVGLELNLEVKPGPDDPSAPERKQREISYSLCSFGDYATVIKTDGTPILNDEEAELVDSYVQASNDMQNGKTDKKRQEGAKKVEELRPSMRPIYEKVITYVKENLKTDTGADLDLVKECGYQAWDEYTTNFVNQWIEVVDAGYDPNQVGYQQYLKMQSGGSPVTQVVENAPSAPVAPTTIATTANDIPDDLPF